MSVGLSGNVLLLGGSGFLGRALLLVAREENWDCRFTIYSRDEYKQDLCRRRYPEVRYVLGDVRDGARLEAVMHGHETVIHGAALKYIPEAEANVEEAINVNLDGSRTVIAAAIGAKVETVVGVSTDKAVNPNNVYGATKMLMERMFIEASGGWSDTNFALVRYGNVIASTGSVIPLLLRQVAEGKAVTITDPNMTRFWITYREAVGLIERAWQVGGGQIVVPQTAAMRMDDLAEAVLAADSIHMSEVKVIGPRPGEKQHEAMITFEESARVWRDAGYFHIDRTTVHGEPFVMTSNNPQRWWAVDDMTTAIIDAGRV